MQIFPYVIGAGTHIYSVELIFWGNADSTKLLVKSDLTPEETVWELERNEDVSEVLGIEKGD